MRKCDLVIRPVLPNGLIKLLSIDIPDEVEEFSVSWIGITVDVVVSVEFSLTIFVKLLDFITNIGGTVRGEGKLDGRLGLWWLNRFNGLHRLLGLFGLVILLGLSRLLLGLRILLLWLNGLLLIVIDKIIN